MPRHTTNTIERERTRPSGAARGARSAARGARGARAARGARSAARGARGARAARGARSSGAPRAERRAHGESVTRDGERMARARTTATRGFTRRQLFQGVAALAGLAAGTTAALEGCAPTSDVAEPTYVEDGAQTSVLDTYEYVEEPPALTEAGSWTLPLGTVLHPSEGTWIAATTTGEANVPPVKASAFSLVSGTLADVVSRPVTKGANMMILTARCSDKVFAWSEVDVVKGNWVLYAAPFDGGKITAKPTELWSADGEWDTPLFACTDDRVIWQVMPTATGSHSAEDSVCYVWRTGRPKAVAAVTSHGRFATEPAVSEGTVTLTPRVREDEGVFYGIYAYSVQDDLSTVIDSMVLPQTIKPMSAVRMGDDFVFQVEANYQSGGLLGNMGTYLGKSGGPFVAVSREPSTPAAGRYPIILVKSRSSYVDADVANETYSVVPALDHSVDYGEYPARIGTCDTFVTYATVKDETSGFPKDVQVRAFAIQAA